MVVEEYRLDADALAELQKAGLCGSVPERWLQCTVAQSMDSIVRGSLGDPQIGR